MSSPNVNQPSNILPEHLHGYIELKTLQDIHYYLSESHSKDEQNDAEWISTNFLYEPINETGRSINTTDSYARLFKAYTDVKKLTGKAQDKWPFFNQIWKEIPLATIRKLAKGDSVTNIHPRGIGLKAQKLASGNEQKDPDNNNDTASEEIQRNNGQTTNGHTQPATTAVASPSKSATEQPVPTGAPGASAESTAKNFKEPSVPKNKPAATDASTSDIAEPSVPTNVPTASVAGISKNIIEPIVPITAPARTNFASRSKRITRQSIPTSAPAASVASKPKNTTKQSVPKATTNVDTNGGFSFPRLGLAVESEPPKTNLDKLPPAKMMRDYYERKLDIDEEREERRARIEEENKRKGRKHLNTNDESQAQEQRKRARLDEENPAESHEGNGHQLPTKGRQKRRARFDDTLQQYFSERLRPVEQAPTSFERTALNEELPPMPYDSLREERHLWAADRSIPREEQSTTAAEAPQKKGQKRSSQNDNEEEHEKKRPRTSHPAPAPRQSTRQQKQPNKASSREVHERTTRKASALNGTVEGKVGAKKIADEALLAPKTATISYFARIRLAEAQIDVPIPTKMVNNDHHDMVMQYTVYKAGNDNALSFEDFQAGVKLGKKP